MPRPDLKIDVPYKGEPSQPVPLRLAFFVSGLEFDAFMILFHAHLDDNLGSLRGYEYTPGAAPRQVRKQSYEKLHEATWGYSNLSDRVSMLPANHFVWSPEFAYAVSEYIQCESATIEEFNAAFHLNWNPPLHGMDALIEECIDLSGLGDRSEYAEEPEYAEDAAFLKPQYAFHRTRAGTWMIFFEGRPCVPFQDSQGLRYLKHLLLEQGKTLSAVELSALVNQPDESTEQQVATVLLARDDEEQENDAESLQMTFGGDAGEVIDEKARNVYRRQIQKLTDQLDEAQEFGDVERAEKIREEIKFLTRELRASVRPDGRPRRDKSTAKRAYDAVNKALKKTQDDLTQHCPDLGKHLTNSLKYVRGDGWIYQPPTKIHWLF